MPTHRAPGVHVEETSCQVPAIVGTDRGGCAFVGPTRAGPGQTPPQALTSYAEFVALHGGPQDLVIDAAAGPMRHHLAHAARAYFDNGGRRLYVASTAWPADAAAYAAALQSLADLDDVASVAAPGHSALYRTGQPGLYEDIAQALLAHVSTGWRCRVAVLDAPDGATLDELRVLRARMDCSHAALYHPWVVVANPLAGPGSPEPAELALPPSGFICGIHARSDPAHGLHQAPADETLHGALRLNAMLGGDDAASLNGLGVNCLRALPAGGVRVWGARTLSSDPEWTYLPVRRYLDHLEASLRQGLQWTVFEPNAEPLWAQVTGAVSNFLYNGWRNGALLGSRPNDAYFVRCDRSTLTQADLDQGRLVCVVGVAVLKPAEFLVWRVALRTADAA